MLNDLAALYAGNPAVFAGSVFVLGLIVGSFLNVVIYRLPIMLEREWRAQAAELLSADRRAPPRRRHRVQASPRAVDFEHTRLRLPRLQGAHQGLAEHTGGELAAAARPLRDPARARISVRYPLVELATGSLVGLGGLAFRLRGARPPAHCWSPGRLIALTGIDIDHQLLPDGITLPLMWAGLLAAVVVGPIAGSPIPVSARDALIGAAAGYVSLWLVFHAFRLITGKEGMGYGDFKLFAALGAWLGWKLLPLVILLSAATGAVLGILMIVLRGRDRALRCPLGHTSPPQAGSP